MEVSFSHIANLYIQHTCVAGELVKGFLIYAEGS